MKLCKPLKNPVQSVLILCATAAFTLVSAVFAVVLREYALFFKFTSIFFLIIGFLFLLRFNFLEYVYVLSDSTLTVRQLIGKRDEAVFSIEFDKETALCRGKRPLKAQNCAGGDSYRQNLSAVCAYIIYKKNGQKLYMEFEPNEAFYSMVEDAIKDAKS